MLLWSDLSPDQREGLIRSCWYSHDARWFNAVAQEFGLALSTVSHHLKELRNAGLVLCSKHGKKVHCRVNTALLRELEEFMR